MSVNLQLKSIHITARIFKCLLGVFEELCYEPLCFILYLHVSHYNSVRHFYRRQATFMEFFWFKPDFKFLDRYLIMYLWWLKNIPNADIMWYIVQMLLLISWNFFRSSAISFDSKKYIWFVLGFSCWWWNYHE